MFFVAYASLFVLSLICFGLYFKYGGFAQGRATNPTFLQFQRPYIVFYGITVLGDWLQGPYLYKLYHYHGFLESQVALIYVVGLIASVVFTPVKEIVSDRFGRKATAVLCALLYGTSSILATVPVYAVLLAGRVLGGVANSFLFAAMETWYTYEHLEKHDFPKEWIPITFGLATFVSSIAAIVAGVLADVLAHWFGWGPPSPYFLAGPVLIGVAIAILIKWSENYGPEDSRLSRKLLRQSFLEGLKSICTKSEVFLVGSIQALFESTIFIFVFIWTPTLSPAKSIYPLGIIFATFMVSFLIGELVCKHLATSGVTPGAVFLGMSATAGLAFYVAAYFAAFPTIAYLCFIIFEFACGIYFPVMGDIRERHLPEEHRLSVVSIFRIPLTVISSTTIWLYHYDMKGGIREILIFCGILMTGACICALRFVSVVREDAVAHDDLEAPPTAETGEKTGVKKASTQLIQS